MSQSRIGRSADPYETTEAESEKNIRVPDEPGTRTQFSVGEIKAQEAGAFP